MNKFTIRPNKRIDKILSLNLEHKQCLIAFKEAEEESKKIKDELFSRYMNKAKQKSARDIRNILHIDQGAAKRLPISEVDLGRRAFNILHGLEVEYVGDLLYFTEYDLIVMPNLGRGTLEEIIKVLDEYGLKLSTDKNSIKEFDKILRNRRRVREHERTLWGQKDEKKLFEEVRAL